MLFPTFITTLNEIIYTKHASPRFTRGSCFNKLLLRLKHWCVTCEIAGIRGEKEVRSLSLVSVFFVQKVKGGRLLKGEAATGRGFIDDEVILPTSKTPSIRDRIRDTADLSCVHL